MNLTINLDCACDMTLGEFSEFCEENEIVSYKSIDLFGPAGGNPYIELTFANKTALRRFEAQMEI